METILTEMMPICSGLVFVISLNEKVAPERKKTPNQNSKVLSKPTSPNNLDNVLPVIMHLDMETPSR